MHGQLNPDARDRGRRDRESECLAIAGECLIEAALFGVDGRERAQRRHAPATIERYGADRKRALEEVARPLPVAERVVVDADAVQAVPLTALRLNFSRQAQRLIEKTQRLVEAAERVVDERGVVAHRDEVLGIRL